jgi:hypothetical protein
MLFFIVFLLIHFLVDPPTSYLAWHDWALGRGMSIAITGRHGNPTSITSIAILTTDSKPFRC